MNWPRNSISGIVTLWCPFDWILRFVIPVDRKGRLVPEQPPLKCFQFPQTNLHNSRLKAHSSWGNGSWHRNSSSQYDFWHLKAGGIRSLGKITFHLSFHSGFLFSTNAVIPSFLSSVAKVDWKSLFSNLMPSLRESSKAELVASLQICTVILEWLAITSAVFTASATRFSGGNTCGSIYDYWLEHIIEMLFWKPWTQGHDWLLQQPPWGCQSGSSPLTCLGGIASMTRALCWWFSIASFFLSTRR